MSVEELDKKYEPYTMEGFTGIEFWLDETYNTLVSTLLDEIIEIYPDFKIYQLKEKFGSIRFYTNLPPMLQYLCEDHIEQLYKSSKKKYVNEKRIEQESKECHKN